MRGLENEMLVGLESSLQTAGSRGSFLSQRLTRSDLYIGKITGNQAKQGWEGVGGI